MSISSRIEFFLKSYCHSSSPILLAFSGGPDSLCLFYALLDYRKRFGVPFHTAHVDHGWREESRSEAKTLQKLADDHSIPFYLKTLNPQDLKGNLEAACRVERYSFFASLYHQLHFQAILTGHHKDDQKETVCKRIFEGAHWSRWIGLKPESWWNGCRILRPLIEFSKDEIATILPPDGFKPLNDPTNQNLKFLRTRLRKTLFPELNRTFGKNILNNIIEVSEEMSELASYFESRLEPFLNKIISGPWGVWIDLKNSFLSKVEMKYFLRLLCLKLNFYLSREIIAQAAKALMDGKANQRFVMNGKSLHIDRYRLFIILHRIGHPSEPIPLQLGQKIFRSYSVNLEADVYHSCLQMSSWKEGWGGEIKGYLPQNECYLNFTQIGGNLKSIKKKWSKAKIPAFLYPFFPIITDKNGNILHEFLTGKPTILPQEGEPCWKIKLNLNPGCNSW